MIARAKLSRTQQRVYDALTLGRTLRYFAPSFGNGGFFYFREANGDHYNLPLPPVPYTTIPALVKKGALVLVSQFATDATQSVRTGNLRGHEYRRA